MTRSFREILQKAQRDVHETFKVAAACYPDGNPNGRVVKANIRVHTRYNPVGEVEGETSGLVQRIEIQPQLIFRRDEHIPTDGEVVIISPNEGYKVVTIRPVARSEIMVEVEVCSLTENQLRPFAAAALADGWGTNWGEDWE